AAIVLDTGAASRGSDSANTSKEKDVRKWFIERDLIEGVIYLPENLFYNTPARGIILVLNKVKANGRKNKILIVNAGDDFERGKPKNYLADDAIARITQTFKTWKEVEGYSRVIPREEVRKNDFNILPSRYVHRGGDDDTRPLADIIADIEALETEVK